MGKRADALPLGVGEAGATGGEPAVAHGAAREIDAGELLRVGYGERAEAHGVEQLEDGGIGANAKGE